MNEVLAQQEVPEQTNQTKVTTINGIERRVIYLEAIDTAKDNLKNTTFMRICA